MSSSPAPIITSSLNEALTARGIDTSEFLLRISTCPRSYLLQLDVTPLRPKARWFKHVQGNEVLWPIQVCCLFDRKPLKSCRIRDCTFGYEHGNKASGVGFQTTSLPGITP